MREKTPTTLLFLAGTLLYSHYLFIYYSLFYSFIHRQPLFTLIVSAGKSFGYHFEEFKIYSYVYTSSGDIMYLLNSFFVYSFIGYVVEILFGVICLANNPESGILYGPWTPIYGIASIIIIFISENLFKNLRISKWVHILLVFFVIVLALMFLEFIGGYLIEIVFGFSFWDYSSYKFHIGKYTCLEMGIIWGVLGILFIYYLRPFLDKYIRRIPKIVTVIFTFLFVFDLVMRLLKEFFID